VSQTDPVARRPREQVIMSDPVDYWDRRNKQVSRLSALKRRPLVQWLLSVRIGDEAFIRTRLSGLGRPRVLDVACGVGKMQISALAGTTYGVDIAGFPSHVAAGRGYRTVEYAPPGYAFTLPESVDVVTCVDLNAHVDFETFATIIRSALSHLGAGGRLLLIGEFDNDGIGYRVMKWSPARFRDYVLGMKHWHFSRESEFIGRFEALFPELGQTERAEVVCVPPLSHFYACFAGRDVSTSLGRALFLAADVGLSLLNNLLRRRPAPDSAFRVGFVYERRHRA
jgi:SAM-dependent methyltransferase